MKTGTMTRRVKVRAGKRALKMLADQAIGHDLLKGLIELITNSDESYARLEARDVETTGRIEIEVDRRPRKKQTIVRVTDWAEGMDESRLEMCVGSYGEDTSGQVGRGVFGMGLKDTINAFGVGTITCFKEGKKFCCVLTDIEDLEIHPGRPIIAADKQEFRNTDGGTVAEVVVQNPKVKIPFVDSLRQQLQTHVCLRSIMTDSGRKVLLRDLRSGSADELRYAPPEGESVLDGIGLSLPSYRAVRASLTVKRAIGSDPLSQSGSYRTGGILITSRRTCHESTLFGYDDDPHAAKLFGELRCDQIYDLQAAGEPIVDKNRNGLRKDHPLTKELFEAAKREIEKIVAAEKDRERQQRQRLERDETLRRFKEAIKNLNEIAKRELQIGGMGSGTGHSIPTEPVPPQDGFEFMPDTYRVLVAERESLKLRVQVDGTTGIAVGDKVEVTCDNPHIRILDDTPVVPKLFHEEPPLSIVHVSVEGLQANAQGFVTAKYNGKSAIAAIESQQTSRTPKTKRLNCASSPRNKTGRLSANNIDYESGSRSDRAEFQYLFADASRRKFDLVLFWALDRLSREGALKTLQHLDRLESYGVGFRSFTEPYFDSCGIFKEAVVSIVATLAKQERVKRAERTRAGLAIARAKGKTLGRPRTVEAHSADIARLKAQGHSLRAIGRSLGISERSVRRLTAA